MFRFSEEDLEYLSGARFSGFHKVTVSRPEARIPLRSDLLEDLCRDRRVVHLGFADHLPYIGKKVEEDTWLHGRLRRCAARCLGIDRDAAAVRFVAEELGVDDVLCGDVLERPVREILDDSWDFLLIGEVLEHVDDPVGFLSRLNALYAGCVARIVITAPNAFWLKNFSGATRHTERLNTDHRYWFTAFTLGKIVVRAGMVPEGFRYCERQPVKRLHRRLLLRRYPSLRETLLMVVRPVVREPAPAPAPGR